MTTIATARSINGKLIRLTTERYQHISENHGELSGLTTEILATIRQPKEIFIGNTKELIAVGTIPQSPKHCLVVVYRETTIDGFVITAFITSKLTKLQNVYHRIYP